MTAVWEQVKADVEASLSQFTASMKAEELELVMRAAELSTQIGVEKLLGKDTTVGEQALVSAYLSIQAATTQAAALVAVKVARDALRRALSVGLSLLAGL